MSGATTYNPAEADMLDQLCDDLSMPETSLVWEVYVERGFDMAAQAAKSFKSAFKTRYKVTDTPPPAVLDALNTLYGQLGDWDAVLTRLSAPMVEQKRVEPGQEAGLLGGQTKKATAPDPWMVTMGGKPYGSAG